MAVEIDLEKLLGVECLRCGHTWIRRSVELPRLCPRCHSAYYNKPRKKKGVEK